MQEDSREQGDSYDETPSISSLGFLVVSSGSPFSDPFSVPDHFVYLGDQTSRSGPDPASIEDAQHQNPAQSQPYEVTREYKVFRGYDRRPTSEVTAQIDFVPPDVKTFKIVQTRGNSWGAKIVRELLSSETSSTRKEHSTEISRANYDFVFLRQQNFGDVPEYVFAIFPKRKDKYLLRGQIWVDAHSFRIRQIEGVPAKSPSFWLKNLHITLQYGEFGVKFVFLDQTRIQGP